VKNWTIGKRVSILCALLISFIVICGAVAVIGLLNISSNLREIATRSVPALEELSKIQGGVLEARGSTLMMAVPGMGNVKALQKQRMAKIHAYVSANFKSYESGITDPQDRRQFDALHTAVEQYFAMCENFRVLATDNKVPDAVNLYSTTGHTAYTAMKKAMAAEVKFNNERAAQQLAAGSRAMRHAIELMSWLAFGAFLGGCILAYIVIKGINESLRHSVNEVAAFAQQARGAADQLAASSNQLATGSSEQAATLEETSASSHQISAMTTRNAENATAASRLMAEVDTRMTEAGTRLEAMVESMSAIDSSSRKIGSIMKVIDEIAFQTNLLALNAAVEAARAGEAGAGFAVVADEVRALAQRCAEAARNTSSLIEESVTNAKVGTERIEGVTSVIHSVAGHAARVRNVVDEVSAGAQEQDRGNQQIKSALEALEMMTQTTAATAEESAAASAQLQAQAKAMEAVVIDLSVLVQ